MPKNTPLPASPLNESSVSRRSFLAATGFTVAGASVGFGLLPPSWAQPQVSPERASASDGVGRFVFMPCIHFREDLNAPEGFAQALAAADHLEPDFLLMDGDLCHGLRDLSLDACEQRARQCLDVLNANWSRPVRHMIGNHDLAAWSEGGGLGG